MDRELNQARRWLDTAVKGIRFGPDRRAARAELAAHMEDKAADLRRIFPDMTAQEAEERALSEMGDPAEVGKALAKIHRPWLGWLWRASQGALAVMLLLLALAGANVILGSASLGGWYGRESGRRANQDGAVVLAPVEERAALEGCTITAPEAVLWTGGEGKELEVVLRVEDLRFWRKGGGQLALISAVDDLGGRYNSQYERRLGLWSGQGDIHVLRDGWGPFHQTYLLRVTGIDPAARWVRLDYDWLGRGFSLTVDLTKEAGA